MRLLSFVRASDHRRVYVRASAIMLVAPGISEQSTFTLTIQGQTPIVCVGDIHRAADRINAALGPTTEQKLEEAGL